VIDKVVDSELEINPVDNKSNNNDVSEDFAIDFCSRYFRFDGYNDEQGSHCALGPYFGARRGKRRLLGLQNSERGGLVECSLMEDVQRVYIIGSTVTTLTGKTQINT
jgi:hypothetical protein